MNIEEMVVDERAALSLEIEGDGVAWLVFDRPDSRVNLLTAGVMRRLDELVGVLEERARAGEIRAVVVRSGKAHTFIAGADVTAIAAITDRAEGEAAARLGQVIYRRLELLPIPTVAAVDGLCLGGGTELTLACGHRLASDRPETKIGLPEVRLGILPGWGGTTRLPRLIGLKEALGLILTGRTVDARRALRIGLIDEMVPVQVLYERAAALAREVAEHGPAMRRRKPLSDRLLNETLPGRRIVLARARAKVLKETRGRYPAPLKVIETVGRSIGAPLERAFAHEARALGELVASDVSKNLIHVFNLMEGARKGAPAGATARAVERAGVVGAGVMGGGIAQLLAAKDVAVRLKDIRPDAIRHGLAHARRVLDRAVEKRRMQSRDAERAMNHIAPTLDYSGFGNLQLVIEAVVERMDVKKSVLAEVESRVPEACVLTTNTSTLSVTAMQQALARPADFCGMHFFNPVDRMPLVEVIRGAATSDDAVATVFEFARRLDKTPVIVEDGPGFLVNRVLAPYLNEAGYMLGEGVSIDEIDRALLDFGMPMGPLRLLDEVGLDIARHAAEVMHAAFGERLEPSPALDALGGTGLLGRKGGRGFYRYEGDEQNEVNEEIYALLGRAVPAERVSGSRSDIQRRCLFAMVNEAARVLEDGIVASAGDVDLGMITGTGFPPFRGGLLRWADSLGSDVVLQQLTELEQSAGTRFAPARSIRHNAANGRGFYG